MNEQEKPTGRGIPWLLVGLPTLVVVGLVLYIVQPLIFPEPLPEELTSGPVATVEEAKAALRQKDYAMAGTLAYRVLMEDPTSSEACLIAGESAFRLGDYDAALKYYQAVSDSDKKLYVTAQWAAGNVNLAQGRLREAEQLYRRSLSVDPKNIVANERLAFVLGIEGRRWESLSYLFEPIKQGHIAMEPLLLLGAVETMGAEQPELIQTALQSNPKDLLPLIGQAHNEVVKGDLKRAAEILEKVLDSLPGQVEAHSLLGLIYTEFDDPVKWQAWIEQLSPASDTHPDSWLARGIWAQNHGQRPAAARCFWEAVRLNPNHQRANYRLAQVLAAMNRKPDAEVFLSRSRLLERLSQLHNLLYKRREQSQDLGQMIEAAELSERLGRLWEAWAWYHLVLVLDPGHVEARRQVSRLTERISGNPPLVIADAVPTRNIDLAGLPLPSWKDATTLTAADTGGMRPDFADVAPSAGINFSYNNGDDPNVDGFMLAQEMGGAVVVLDFDRDGWPDLYLAQGGSWPIDDSQTDSRDQLFRNLGNGQFQNVTVAAGLGDCGYSQGATAGDFDNDGYTDLFVANLGANRLYHNQGDGTFVDVTQAAGIAGKRWSTSCVIADCNGDTWPDLFVVNYLAGREPLVTECFENGKKRYCPPTNFPGERDRLYVNRGDGSFQDLTDELQMTADDAKGLGVVAADLQGKGQLSLFVANDTTANFFYINQAARRGDPMRLEDRGLLTGLAYDRDGLSQGSMGIATGDGDGDGLIDLYVTNFYLESNTYYRQVSTDFFADATRESHLRQPSIDQLAFGTQFIDFDLDRDLDLAVACGHIDDASRTGQPGRMKPQFYRNQGRGRYALVPSDRMGPYFQEKYFGRALATLDWNRDGRPDFAVTHLYKPFALLENRTDQHGNYLQLLLRGVGSDRDAIGATVRVDVDGRTTVHQLVAGDGFHCRCEPMIQLGLGSATIIDRLAIRWPDGTEQTFSDVDANRCVVLVEGRQNLFDLPLESR